MKLKLKINSGLYSINLDKFKPYCCPDPSHAQYFPSEPGVNHHKLLAYLSSQLPEGSRIADLGTLVGQSAASLSYNQGVQVTSFDIKDYLSPDKSIRNLNNVKFIKEDCFRHLSSIQKCELIFLDIAPHGGEDEKIILDELLKRYYTGIVILDDIYFNQEMTALWESIKLKKINATKVGHHSGTGIVVFDPEIIDVEMLI